MRFKELFILMMWLDCMPMVMLQVGEFLVVVPQA